MSKQIENLIERYVTAHELAWAPTTLRSERARLNAVANLIASGPRALYEAKVQTLGSYSLRMLFTRITDLEKWAKRGWGYGDFMKWNARLFKHAYKKERIDVTNDTITLKISAIRDDYLRTLARGMYTNGLRISELRTYNKVTRLVVGKGQRVRRLLSPDTLVDQLPSERQLGQLRRELQRVGLKPHTLRKAAATLLARGGMQSQDLMHVMGWSNLQTAASYLQPQQDDALAAFAKGLLG